MTTHTTPRTAATVTPERVLSAATGMDAVTLRVGALDEMTSYYSNALVLETLAEQTQGREAQRLLGRAGVPLLRLIHTPELPAVDPTAAGLFHTAFLFPDAASLAATVYSTAQEPRSRFAGSSDHLVSEAFYFTDPEGNGIELYTDRDRSEWSYDHGRVRMDTIRLDPNAYLARHLSEQALAEAPQRAGSIGHVHLQVGDIATARAFYVDAIGFEITLDTYPGALFTSAGGYHHHLGMNTWNSRGAGPRAASLGLGEVAVAVPGRDDLDALVARLRRLGIPFADDGRSVQADDPWGTQVTVALADGAAADAPQG